jgi:hypothetical protein
MVHMSLECLKRQTHHQHQQGIQNQITHKWTIKTSHFLKNV